MSKTNALVVCISGPSGVGKGTVIKRLRQKNPRFWLSISATSRPPRPHEQDKRDYFFLDETEFIRQINQGEILEYDYFCDAYYGTPRSALEAKLAEGQDIVMDITVKGALAIKAAMKEAITIFLLPPDRESLLRRLKSRDTETDAAIAKRLARSAEEIAQAAKFDYRIVNDNLDRCVEEIAEIIRLEKNRRIE